MGPVISVVIPNMNGRDMLLNCLNSIFSESYPKVEVIVVDNASTDSSLESVRKKFPCVKVVSFSSNRGFSSAVNAGIRAASGDYLFLLNNDTVIAPGSIFKIAEYIEASEGGRVGSYQVAMLDFSERERVDALGIDIDETYTGMQVGKGAAFKAFNAPKELWGVCAGAGVYKKEMLEDIRVGEEYFDEDFFAFYEDVDLSARARLRGWECRLAVKACVYHIGGGTAMSTFRKNYLLTRNRLLLIIKTTPVQVIKKWVTQGRLFNCSLIKHYVLNRDYLAVAAIFYGWLAVLPLFFTMIKKRRTIISGRRVSYAQIFRWFS